MFESLVENLQGRLLHPASHLSQPVGRGVLGGHLEVAEQDAFQYLQAVIEQVTGQSLEEVAQEMVFTPLGMSSSSFVNPTQLTPGTANGHLRAIVPVLIFAILYALSLVIVG